MSVDLSNHSDNPPLGSSRRIRVLWHLLEPLTLRNPLFRFPRLKIALLRAFGASIGRGINLAPNVHIRSPWLLRIGDHSWIGEGVWIDNYVLVDVGADVCISQGAYLCTGNHDWGDAGMSTKLMPIVVGNGAWIAAFAVVAPGVRVGVHSVVTLGSILLHDTEPMGIYRGNPAERTGTRIIRSA